MLASVYLSSIGLYNDHQQRFKQTGDKKQTNFKIFLYERQLSVKVIYNSFIDD